MGAAGVSTEVRDQTEVGLRTVVEDWQRLLRARGRMLSSVVALRLTEGLQIIKDKVTL